MQLFFKIIRITLIVLKIIGYTLIGLFVTYAVAFSIAGTIMLYKGYRYFRAPIQEVAVYKTLNPQRTKFMEQCLSGLVADSLTPDTLLHTFIPLDSISPNLTEAVIAAEDDGFYLHPGIDVASILAAAEYNRTLGKNIHGASTLTQQMAKNLFLTSERTFDRKIKELLYAVLMERYLGKDRILELYMNYAQWGRNIFGCEAAAQFYYKKSAKKLSRNEAARLAAVLAKPSTLTPYHTKSIYMGKRLAVIAQNLYLHHSIGDSDYFALTGTMPPVKPEKDSAQQSVKATERKIERQSF
ncbi:MAG: monofunctional biosynthetic peptidoglycan transglycosylase [Chitinispirillaceae bacterium]|nr:monofunctional biosynthetic peptidoglycan transglycosylase [Chitinispirillaceae bacterium]